MPASAFVLNNGNGKFRDVAAELGGGFDQPKVGRDRVRRLRSDGDLDLLLTPTMGGYFTATTSSPAIAVFVFASSYEIHRDAIVQPYAL